MLETIPHLVRMCRHPFAERVLLLDTAPLGPGYRTRSGIGTMEQLRECCEKLMADGTIDRCVDIDYSSSLRQYLYNKHFGGEIGHTHDFRGYPIYGTLFSLEEAKTDYVLHFDSDMLLFQAIGSDWINTGIELLQRRKDVLFVAPRPGPPAKDGDLKQRGVAYHRDRDGFFSFSEFTSRKYLIQKSKFERFLPIRPCYVSWKRRAFQFVTGRSGLLNWEIAISRQLEKCGCLRADLDTKDAWTLHTPDHGAQFLQQLPNIIRLVENGCYPDQQGGDYDLHLELWQDMLSK